jgi:hypothetical protein
VKFEHDNKMNALRIDTTMMLLLLMMMMMMMMMIS